MNSDLHAILDRDGYENLREFPDGVIAGISQMMFTTALVVGLDEAGYQRRYCYERKADAVAALDAWDGSGDPSGPWIKEKPSDRLGPGATK